MLNMLLQTILVVGWPILVLATIIIIKQARNFSFRLKDTIMGKLIWPTIIGWLFGMYSLGAVSTAYMLGIPWEYVVPPIMVLFLVALLMVLDAMKDLEKEALELQEMYTDLGALVEKRTKQLEVAQEKRLLHEKEIQDLKDQFVFIAAHELRTPVTAIKWGIEMIIDEGGKNLDKKTMDQLEEVQDSNERLIHLVEDLLNVARIESKTIRIKNKDFNISKLLQETMDSIERDVKKKKLNAKMVVPKKVTVFSDAGRIKQVVENLLSNAVKYNLDGGSIILKLEVLKDTVSIHVEDTGFGISSNDMKKLFTKFGRIRTKQTEAIEGTGLGLYVSKEIAQQMGGDITVSSTVDKGTAFVLTLPKKGTLIKEPS